MSDVAGVPGLARGLYAGFLPRATAEAIAAAALRGAGVPSASRTLLSVSSSIFFPGSAVSSSHVSMRLLDALRVLRGEGTMPGGVRAYLAQCTLDGGGDGVGGCAGARALSAAVRGAWGSGAAWPPPAVAAAAAREHGGALFFSQCNLWACDTGGVTLTGTHFDASANVLVVLRGAKRVLAAPFAARALLRPAPLCAATPNHADADLFERGTVADFAGAVPSRALPPPAIDATLRPGDALFLPEGWWHSVLSEAGTVGVNFWFATRAGGARVGDAEYEARLALLALGRRRVAEARAALLGRGGAPPAWASDGSDRLAERLATLCGGGAAEKRPRCGSGSGGVGGGGGPATAEEALLAVAGGEGGGRRALRALAALLAGEGGAARVRALFAALSADALDALQSVWEAEEEEAEEEEGGEEADQGARSRAMLFQRVWAAAWGDAAAQHLADSKEAVMRAALERAAASLLQ
jgi:hypothetical protein